MSITRRGLAGLAALVPMISVARSTPLPWKKPRGSIITLSFSNITYDIELKALFGFRPVTDFEGRNVGGGANTKLDYLFVCYAKETAQEIMEMIAWSSEAGHFGSLTQVDGNPFAFRGPDNAFGPLPITGRDSPNANAAIIIKRRRKQVTESPERVAEVIEECGGLAVPPVPDDVMIEAVP